MKCERSSDARTLSPEGQYELRVRAVKRVQAGESPEEVARVFDVNPSSIYRWVSRFYYGGWEALRTGARSGRPTKLTWQQMRWLARTIRDKSPYQMKFGFALWTVGLVRELIRVHLGIRVSEATVNRTLRALGLSPQRPVHSAWQQDPKAVERWKRHEYPKLKRRAKREDAVILFADEAGIRTDEHLGRTWGERGNTPVVKTTGRRESLNIFSAVSAKGDFRFKVNEGNVNATTFCQFLEQLVGDADRKLIVVVDGHPAHRAKKTQRKVDELDGWLELHFLPGYSPELNPDEFVWGQLKHRVSKRAPKTKTELFQHVRSVLHSLQKLPGLVMSFFRTPSCRYAAP